MNEAEYQFLWRIMEISEGVIHNTLRDLHNSSYNAKAEFNNCFITSIDVKFTFDSACLGFFSSANVLQIADVTLRVVFLLFLPCF